MKETDNQELNNGGSHWENELIRRVREGSSDAFNELVELHQKAIFKLAYGFFHDKDDAMEIVQETFLRVYEKIDSYQADNRANCFKNWLYRISSNICVDYYRKFKKSKADDRDIFEYDQNLNIDSSRTMDETDRQHFNHILNKGIESLSKQQQKIFSLKYFSGLKHNEISEVLKISTGAVKSMYNRALKSLEKQLFRMETGQ